MFADIASEELEGYSLHPAFTGNDGNTQDHVYIGAFEATTECIVEDTTNGVLVGEMYEDPADADGATLDEAKYQLCSIAGYKPKAYQSLDEFRTMANNRGTGWHQMRYVDHSLIQLLFYLEYASLNSQSALGQGIVSKDSGSYNESELTDSNHGDWTYSTDTPSYGVTTDGLHAVVYRGIENPWGNIWKWLDNCIIKDDGYYMGIGVSPNDTGTGYTHIDILPLGHDGYVSGYFDNIVQDSRLDYAFFPSSLNGSSSTYFSDYHWSFYPGRIVAPLVGGSWYYGSQAGLGCLSLSNAPSYRVRYIGSRLLYIN
jgi:hypothetical protein